MSKALYRKYRSKKLSEIVGQEHITRTLDNALKTGKISHAYLFTGPRGVGKTSIARILAHEINQLPYTDESIHMDIIEIDAASNRRIDEIRDLREKVHTAPTSAKYKVYIIDEVHMLTKEAFNALLKTLEEPPAHVVFILATTELHKLPETIISRTQRFTFKPIAEAEAVKHLSSIAKAEGMEIDKDALQLLARHGRGSFRDSISLLDQVGNSQKTITKADAEKLVGLAHDEHLDNLEQAVFAGSPADLVQTLDKLTDDGVGAPVIARQLAARLRQRIIQSGNDAVALNLLADLLGVPASPDPAGQLEVVLYRANLQANPAKTVSDKKTMPLSAPKPVAETITDSPVPAPAPQGTPPESAPAPDEPQPPQEADIQPSQNLAPVGELATWWQDVLVHIKSANNTLYGMLRMAEARIEDTTLHLTFGFGFHAKKAADSSTRSKIQEAIKKVTGADFEIHATHDSSVGKKTSPAAETGSTPQPAGNSAPPELASITNIFGGGEVLES